MTLVTDAFTYSDGNLATVSGGLWTDLTTPAFRVVSNTAQFDKAASGSVTNISVHSTAMSSGDHYAQAVVQVSATSNVTVGVAIRLSGGNGYTASIPPSGRMEIHRFDSSTPTLIANTTVSGWGGAAVTNYTIRLSAVGNSITATVLELGLLMSVTDSTYSSNTGVGLYATSQFGADATFDSFEANTAVLPTVPTIIGVGGAGAGTAAISPGLPGGMITDDVMLMLLATGNQAITIPTPNGGTWTEVTNSPQGTGTAAAANATRLTMFWSRYNGTQGNPTTSDSGGQQLGVIFAFRGCITSGNPINTSAGGVDATGPTSLTIPSVTTTVNNCLVLLCVADGWDNASTARYSAWTNANLTTIREHMDGGVTSGLGAGLGMAVGYKTTAGSTGTSTVTVDATITSNAMMTIALAPPPAGTDYAGTIASDWGSLTATATGSIVTPTYIAGTIASSWGDWTGTSAATTDHPATISSAWGTWGADSTASVSLSAVVLTNWGTWIASAVTEGSVAGIISSTWGTWTGLAVATVEVEATVGDSWGTWTATAAGTVTPGASSWAGTITSSWGTWAGTAVGTVLGFVSGAVSTAWGTWTGTAVAQLGHLATGSMTLGGWTATANGSVSSAGGGPFSPSAVRPTSAFGYDLEVVLNWIDGGNNGATITGYVVQVSTNDGVSWTTHATPSSHPVTLTGLLPNTRYLFRVAAVNANGTGAYAVSEWGSTPVVALAPITPPAETTRDASHAGRWGLDVIDGTADDEATSTWTGDGVRVYVVDAMIRNTHNEFVNQSFAVHYAIAGISYNAYTSTADHGTLVSGVAVGATCGVAYDAELVFISCSTSDISTPYFNFVEPFEWIYANHPADTPAIIITSQLWGDDGGLSAYQDTDGRQTSEWFPILDGVVTDLIEDKGLAFVQCVGNTTSPSHFDLSGRPGLVLVGGSTSAGAYSSSSELGPHTTIIGPSVTILTSDVGSNSELTMQTGTSFSAPMVGGAMACWLEANPYLTPRQLVDVLLAESVKDSLTGTSNGAPNRLLYSLADIALTIKEVSATLTSSWGDWTATAIGVEGFTVPATVTTAWGTWTALAVPLVSHSAAVVTSWGTWTATFLARVSLPATITTSWGTWTGTALAQAIQHPGTVVSSWGTWLATANVAVVHPATVTSTWGTWSASAIAYSEGQSVGFISSSWGTWGTTADALVAHPSVSSTSWGLWGATAAGTVVGEEFLATVSSFWGTWTATATGACAHPATITTTWAPWTTTFAGTVVRSAAVTSSWGAWTATAVGTGAPATISTTWGGWSATGVGEVSGPGYIYIRTDWSEIATTTTPDLITGAIASPWGQLVLYAVGLVLPNRWATVSTTWAKPVLVATGLVTHPTRGVGSWGGWSATAFIWASAPGVTINEADMLYLGTEAVDRVYAGSELVWEPV